LGESKGIEDRRVFAIPYVSRDFVCYKRVAKSVSTVQSAARKE
jgi:hypothetical protein